MLDATLTQITQRYETARVSVDSGGTQGVSIALDDIPALVAEVRRLKTALRDAMYVTSAVIDFATSQVVEPEGG